jgi:hypothetical protein
LENIMKILSTLAVAASLWVSVPAVAALHADLIVPSEVLAQALQLPPGAVVDSVTMGEYVIGNVRLKVRGAGTEAKSGDNYTKYNVGVGESVQTCPEIVLTPVTP